MYGCSINKNRRLRKIGRAKSEQNDGIHRSTERCKKRFGENRVNVLRIISRDLNPEHLLLSLQQLAGRFPRGIFLFDFEILKIFLNPPSNLLHTLENTLSAQQKGISELFDVYSTFKTVLVYRNTKGNFLILPKNVYFKSIFKQLGERMDIYPQPIIYLDDIIKEDSHNESYALCEDCSKERISGLTLLPCNHMEIHSNSSKTKNKKELNISLKLTKEKLYNSIKKVPTTRFSKNIPKFPKQVTPNGKTAQVYPSFTDKYNLPVQQVTDESEGEQVISNDHPTMFQADISYGLDQGSVSYYNRNNSNAQSTQGRPHAPPRHPDYANGIARFLSFERWTHTRPDSKTLSEAGFFFTNDGDLVRCFQCGIGLKDFSEEDDPMLEHVRHSKNCPFLPEVLGEAGLASYQARLQATDPEYNRQQQWAQIQSGSAPRRSKIRHPEYRTMEARLRSFTNWPQHLIQTPQQLAESGLYYTGFEDQVRCFACDGGLRRWDPEDDPWTEHCRWFPACPFALEQKGEQFIALVQASVENQSFGANADAYQDITSAMALLRLKESAFESVMGQHKTTCLEMGYTEDIIKESIRELLDRGQEKPTLEEIIVLIDVIRERNCIKKQTASVIESPSAENQRLKSMVYCMICHTNTVNALFLPCTHHEVCMTCADPIDTCPVCNRGIQEKIRTFMV